MKTFPMFLQMTGRRVVIVGGGEQAAQKARLMIRTEAHLTLIAASLDAELTALVTSGRATHQTTLTATAFAHTALVFVATGCPAQDACAHALAKAAGALVNVVDQPDLCDAITPSLVDRDPVVVAIGTEGTAPVLARQIKTQIEAMLEPRLGALAALAGRMRGAVERQVPKPARRALWDWVFSQTPRALFARGAEQEAALTLKHAIAAGGAPMSPQGQISLVGAGPGSADLLTLRAVQRLQQADVIFYDRLVDPSVLELARRDAERVFVGKTTGTSSWPQDRINALIVARAAQGQRVVRLKSGDPGIFGRAGEEITAATAAGIAVEIVPGITAAVAAAASLGQSLTERGHTDHLVLATGTCRPGAHNPDWAAMLIPGTTLALYMAVAQAGAIRANLLGAGFAPDLPVQIVAAAATPQERQHLTTLGALDHACADQGITNPAILLIRNPLPATAVAVASPKPRLARTA